MFACLIEVRDSHSSKDDRMDIINLLFPDSNSSKTGSLEVYRNFDISPGKRNKKGKNSKLIPC